MKMNMEQSRNIKGGYVDVTFNGECHLHVGFDLRGQVKSQDNKMRHKLPNKIHHARKTRLIKSILNKRISTVVLIIL